METLKGLPGQIMLTAENLKSALEEAEKAETVEAVRERLVAAMKMAEVIDQLAREAQIAVDAEQ